MPLYTPAFLVFVMDGCGHCTEYAPRVKRALAGSGVGLEFANVERDRRAAKYRVTGTPTTLVRTRRGTVIRRVGGIDDAEIGRLVAAARA